MRTACPKYSKMERLGPVAGLCFGGYPNLTGKTRSTPLAEGLFSPIKDHGKTAPFVAPIGVFRRGNRPISDIGANAVRIVRPLRLIAVPSCIV